MSDRQMSGWTGWVVFAGVMMVMLGIWHAIVGFAGLFKKDYYVVSSNYAFKLSSTGWGWIHIFLGVIVALAGFAVLSGATWARVVGILLAVVSALGAFVWLPYYPVWGILIVTLDVIVIYALAAHGGDLKQSAM
jgi:hypothetical protein